jgi:CRISPR/Cas system-associated protein Cas10 (large subunit of type III CRISPR-Cas system)
MFQMTMNARQKCITLGSIKNAIRAHDPRGYKQWQFRWDRSVKKKLVYKKGATISMQDAKVIFMSQWDKLKPEALSRVNPNIKVVTKPICKSCKCIHRMSCCEEYSRKNKSSRLYIMNAEVV